MILTSSRHNQEPLIIAMQTLAASHFSVSPLPCTRLAVLKVLSLWQLLDVYAAFLLQLNRFEYLQTKSIGAFALSYRVCRLSLMLTRS